LEVRAISPIPTPTLNPNREMPNMEEREDGE
jgi:hypothetical protein